MVFKGTARECFTHLVNHPDFSTVIRPFIEPYARVWSETLDRWISGEVNSRGIKFFSIETILPLMGYDLVGDDLLDGVTRDCKKLLGYGIITSDQFQRDIDVYHKNIYYSVFCRRHVPAATAEAMKVLVEMYHTEIREFERLFMDKFAELKINLSYGDKTKKDIDGRSVAVVEQAQVIPAFKPKIINFLKLHLSPQTQLTYYYNYFVETLRGYLRTYPEIQPVFAEFMQMNPRQMNDLYVAPFDFFEKANLYRTLAFMELCGFEIDFITQFDEYRRQIFYIIGYSIGSREVIAERFQYTSIRTLDILLQADRYRPKSEGWRQRAKPLIEEYGPKILEARTVWTQKLRALFVQDAMPKEVEYQGKVIEASALVHTGSISNIYAPHIVALARSLLPLLEPLIKDGSVAERDDVRNELGCDVLSQLAQLTTALCSEESRAQCFHLKNEKSRIDTVQALTHYATKKAGLRK